MIYALLLSEWAKKGNLQNFQADLSFDEVIKYNNLGYNIYFYPNYPSICANPSSWINGKDIDVFEWVYVDMDLKDGVYTSKDEFIVKLGEFPRPTRIVDSGNGIHAYWRVSDLDAKSFLQINRQLARTLYTDLAVGKIKQLMRVPGSINTKNEDHFKVCEVLFEDETLVYTAEQISCGMPPLSLEDKQYCEMHYNKTYGIEDESIKISDKIPNKFRQLLLKNKEVNKIWSGNTDDRSESDYRLGHLMLAANFTKEEAASVLVQTAKALGRAPGHRVSYATNIVDKIWGFEKEKEKEEFLSESVTDILVASGDNIKGTRLRGWKYIDDTDHGFRLTQVIGLVAGSGVGKTAIALNMFHGFVHNNPEYDHFFIPLEQPKNEIAERWAAICGENKNLHSKVQVLSNYDNDGVYRHLSLKEIEEYLVEYIKRTGRKVGCVVIDHISVLKNEKNSAGSATQKTLNISEEMKAFALRTNTLLVMQSQTAREKAGIGDIELNKDAAFGSSAFENFCDYLITIWQPLKNCYSEVDCPTITAFKFCKIRHKNSDKDVIQEDVPYTMLFDTKTQTLKQLTQEQRKGLTFWVQKATNKRKQDKKTDIVTYTSVRWEMEDANGRVDNNQDQNRT